MYQSPPPDMADDADETTEIAVGAGGGAVFLWGCGPSCP